MLMWFHFKCYDLSVCKLGCARIVKVIVTGSDPSDQSSNSFRILLMFIENSSSSSYGLNSTADWTLLSWVAASLEKRIILNSTQVSCAAGKIWISSIRNTLCYHDISICFAPTVINVSIVLWMSVYLQDI